MTDAAITKPRGRVLARRIAWLALLAALVLAPLVVRVAWEAAAELAAADAAAATDDRVAEIEHLGRAARWRLPLAPWTDRALDRLDAIADEAEAAGPDARSTALAAHREIRSALLATRWIHVPDRARLDRANDRIAALMADQERDLGMVERDGDEDPEAFHRELLQRMPGPDPWRASVAAIAFVAWIAATVTFIVRGIDRDGRLRPRAALRSGVIGLVALLVWTLVLASVR